MHRLIDYSYIFLTVIFTVYGQLVLKWRLSKLEFELPQEGAAKIKALIALLFDPFIFSGLSFAILASLTWMAAMTKFELSAAYPFMALNFVFVMLIAVPMFGESMSSSKFLGTALIVAGTILIGRG